MLHVYMHPLVASVVDCYTAICSLQCSMYNCIIELNTKKKKKNVYRLSDIGQIYARWNFLDLIQCHSQTLKWSFITRCACMLNHQAQLVYYIFYRIHTNMNHVCPFKLVRNCVTQMAISALTYEERKKKMHPFTDIF